MEKEKKENVEELLNEIATGKKRIPKIPDLPQFPHPPRMGPKLGGVAADVGKRIQKRKESPTRILLTWSREGQSCLLENADRIEITIEYKE